MSLEGNRSENDNFSPAKRLSPDICKDESVEEKEVAFQQMLRDYFIDKERDLPYWEQITTRCRYMDKSRQPDFEKNFAEAIIRRSVNIYRSFYELFEIPDWRG